MKNQVTLFLLAFPDISKFNRQFNSTIGKSYGNQCGWEYFLYVAIGICIAN